MANQKIRLTYLWTDEAVMHDDFAKKISAGMTDWASDFYRRYEFELDVLPSQGDRTTVLKAAKFALKKSQGTRPDLRSSSEILEHEEVLLAEVKKKIEEKNKELQRAVQRASALAAQITPIGDEVRAALDQMGANPPPDPVTLRNLAKRATDANTRRAPLIAALERMNAETARLQEQFDRLLVEKQRLDSGAAVKLARAGAYDGDLREQMTSKFKSAGVGNEKRLSVVFCRVAALLSMRRGKYRTLGETQPVQRDPVLRIPVNFILWPFPYLIIDIDTASEHTLAHEIVHAAGHNHPNARDILKVEKRLAGLKFPKPGMLGGRSILDIQLEYDLTQYETVPGGFFDGPEDDIMNYALKEDLPASQVKLSDAAKQHLTDAFFVKP